VIAVVGGIFVETPVLAEVETGACCECWGGHDRCHGERDEGRGLETHGEEFGNVVREEGCVVKMLYLFLVVMIAILECNAFIYSFL
jgi:hypothetical protein